MLKYQTQKKDKKGFVELTTFSLIILLVITSSLIAYIFIKKNLKESITEISYNSGTNFLENLDLSLNQLLLYDKNRITIPLTFYHGYFQTKNSLLIFKSGKKYTGERYCVNRICHISENNKETIYLNISDLNYTFTNLNLYPGNYLLIFENRRNISKIQIYVK